MGSAHQATEITWSVILIIVCHSTSVPVTLTLISCEFTVFTSKSLKKTLTSIWPDADPGKTLPFDSASWFIATF